MPNSSSSREFYRDRRSSERNEGHRNERRDYDKDDRPSKVIHIRDIIRSASNREIIAIGVPFGKIVNFLNIKHKNQAMIEFEDVGGAMEMMQYVRTRNIRIRGQTVKIKFSIHSSIKAREADDKEYEVICREHSLKDAVPVLRASIDQRFGITYSDFEKLFFEFGEVLRMIMYDKNSYTQALVEMSDVRSAIIAKISLDGQNVFCDSAIIRIDFGMTDHLKINSNGDRCRDYTQNPRRRRMSPQPLPHSQMLPPRIDNYDQPRRLDVDDRYSRKRTYEIANRYETNYPRDDRMGMSFIPPRFDDALCYRSPPRVDYHQDRNLSQGKTVILIDNLPTNLTCDHIYNFVGYYGDVKRVKILFKKPSSALVQMETDFMAEQVVRFLHKVRFDGKEIYVKFSNFNSISIPHTSDENFHLTKDFSDFPLKRYKRAGSKNYRHIYPPNPVLHLANVSQLSHDEIKELFLKIAQVKVKRIESLRTVHNQVLVGFDSVTDAIYGIMKLHNYVLPNSTDLKVSFSKGFLNQQ